jgi:hypothetical protein
MNCPFRSTILLFVTALLKSAISKYYEWAGIEVGVDGKFKSGIF